jgi:glycine cleavage system H protein
VSFEPDELLFSETHEWVHVKEEGGAKLATIGISQFAVEQLNDLVYIELPKKGQAVAASGEFGEVESVKAVSPLYSPVTGEIIEVNNAVAEKLDVLSEDPYGGGWIIKVRISDESGLNKLLDYAAYRRQCAAEH